MQKLFGKNPTDFARRMILLATFMLISPNALAIDPLYQPQMQRLLGALGSIYFLQPLCGTSNEDWRLRASDLIDLDNPSDDRRQRLTGAFNQGYRAYSRLYRDCTLSAEQALVRLLNEAGELSQNIRSRYAE